MRTEAAPKAGGDGISLPNFARTSRALRRTTETLARELVQPAGLCPEWSPTEWVVARAAASMQGTTALLAHQLKWKGPVSWQRFLDLQSAAARMRDEKISTIRTRVDEVLREAGVAAIALKGAALSAMGIYRPGERPMGDLDILVAADDMARVETALRAIGYARLGTTRRHAVFVSSGDSTLQHVGEHPANPVPIEVHSAVAEILPVRPVVITDRLRNRDMPPGLNAYPSVAALVLHLLLHAAGNVSRRAARQIQFHDIALLGCGMEETDWDAVLRLAHSESWWLYAPLALVGRYYPAAIPADVLRNARRSSPLALRYWADRMSLSDVSWSNLRIYAFPAIVWSRSPPDIIRYIRGRLLPSRTAREELEFSLTCMPVLNRVPWYGIPHARRVFRWVISNPPRVQAMVCLQAAFSGADLEFEPRSEAG